jgi:hypothetical protein
MDGAGRNNGRGFRNSYTPAGVKKSNFAPEPFSTMLHGRRAFLLWILLILSFTGYGQQIDTTKPVTYFSGSLSLTTNGFSIIPTFSLNSPAVITQLSWRKRKFSIDPDIRLTPNLKKGSMVLWFRYYPIEKKRFSLRVGAHPAMNFQLRTITDSNGNVSEISQMRRFLAWELAPSLRVSKNWTFGLYYLQGNGLQKDGPQTTHFVNLGSGITNIRFGPFVRMALYPAVYYLNLDGDDGFYFTGTVELSHIRWPVSLSSSINQTFTSSIPGNKIFMWNLSLNYRFSKVMGKLKPITAPSRS